MPYLRPSLCPLLILSVIQPTRFMTIQDFSRVTLVVVDVQAGFDDPIWGHRNNPQAEQNIAQLISHWRKRNRPVIHVQHCSVLPGSPLRPEREGCKFKPEATPIAGEPVFQKTVNSAFIGTELEAFLRSKKIEEVLVVGLTTNHCISTTVRMASNLGFKTFLSADATATFDRVGHDGKHYSAEELHAVTLASLHNEFATVLNTDALLT